MLACHEPQDIELRKSCYQRSREIAEQFSLYDVIADALDRLAEIAVEQGRVQEAEQLRHESRQFRPQEEACEPFAPPEFEEALQSEDFDQAQTILRDIFRRK